MNTRINNIFISALTIIFITILIHLTSCDTTEPIDEIEPGRRDYTWTVDTLKMSFFSSLHRIWGSSENDVWAIGPGGDLSKLFIIMMGINGVMMEYHAQFHQFLFGDLHRMMYG